MDSRVSNLVAIFFLFLISETSFSRTYLPSGCSTYITCKESKNEKQELHGAQTCYHASKKDLVLIKAFWQNDKLEKEFFCANDDGIPVVQAYYKNGELNGEYKTYNRSEKKWDSVIIYKNGLREGVAEIGISGDRKRVTLYKEDKAHGFTLIVDKNGKVLSLENCTIQNVRKDKSECEKIKISGYEKAMSDFLGAKIEEKKSEENRVVEKKYSSGAIRERYKLEGGKTVGRHEYFFENGKPKAFVDYVDGKRSEEKSFFEDGQIESHNFFKNEWNYKVIEYYQNGKIKFEKTESENKEDKLLTDIQYKRFHDNGQISEQGQKLRGIDNWGGDGVFNGEIVNYGKSGHLYSRCTYRKGKPINTCTRWPEIHDYNYEDIYDEKGTLISGRVIERKTDKQMKKVEYFPDGSTKSEIIDPEYEKILKGKGK